MSPARVLCAIPVCTPSFTRRGFKGAVPPCRFCKLAELERYRQLVSIECPRGYEPRALPLRHAGWDGGGDGDGDGGGVLRLSSSLTLVHFIAC